MKKEFQQDEIFKLDEEVQLELMREEIRISHDKLKKKQIRSISVCVDNKSRFFRNLNKIGNNLPDRFLMNDARLLSEFPNEMSVFIDRGVFIK